MSINNAASVLETPNLPPATLEIDADLMLERVEPTDGNVLLRLVQENRSRLLRTFPVLVSSVRTPERADFYCHDTFRGMKNGNDYTYWMTHQGIKQGKIQMHQTREPDAMEVNVEYMLAESAEGRGIATRSVRRLLQYGFNELAYGAANFMIFPDNVRSARVAERVGAVVVPPPAGVRRNFNMWKVFA